MDEKEKDTRRRFLVLLFTASFSLLTFAQYTRPLGSVALSRTPQLAGFCHKLSRRVVEEVGGPDNNVGANLIAERAPAIEAEAGPAWAKRIYEKADVPVRDERPLHLRIPPPSSDDTH
ncbi:MAG: hypothetical protein WA005_14120 [Candidatus Binataceae bacterium]